jgi:hypothetical protein
MRQLCRSCANAGIHPSRMRHFNIEVQPKKQTGYTRQAEQPIQRETSLLITNNVLFWYFYFLCFTAYLEVTVGISLFVFIFCNSKASFMLLRISNLSSALQESGLLEIWPSPTLFVLLRYYGRIVLHPQNLYITYRSGGQGLKTGLQM